MISNMPILLNVVYKSIYFTYSQLDWLREESWT